MSLRSLLRKAALGISLTLGCGSSENKFDRAFDQAQEQLERQGIEVRGGLWNRERDYTLLFREMRRDLGDLEAAVARRNGANSCNEVGLSSYDSSAFYCGPGAVEGNCDRSDSGDCLNQVCYEHDRQYEELLEEDAPLCLWSNQTRTADENFFRGHDRCTENDNCGFYCQLIGAIALNLSAIEHAYDSIGPGCLWEGDYQQPRVREELEEKKPEYKNPRDKKDPEEKEEKPKDESLRGLCRDYYEMGLRDCVDDPASPTELEEIIQGVCYRSSLSSLEADRARLECAYKNNCDDFVDCLNNR